MKHLPFCGFLLPLLARRSAAEFSQVPQVGDNILGAVVFFGYILAALYLTSRLLSSIIHQFSSLHIRTDHTEDSIGQQNSKGERQHDVKNKSDAYKTQRRAWAYYFAGLAICSFSLLSWNMLNFLIVSYFEWTRLYPDTVDFNLSDFFGREGAINVWQWATNSNLFRTFAEDLIRDPETWIYVQLALLYSYAWNLWMGTMGYGFKIEHLGIYFLLDQILPVSFTQTLFLTTVMLQGAQPQILYASNTSSFVKVVITMLYVTILSCISTAMHTQWFFLAIFGLRTLLFAPFFLDRLASSISPTPRFHLPNNPRKTNMWCMLILTVYSLFMIVQTRSTQRKDTVPVEINFAASALRNDFTIGIVSTLSSFIASVSGVYPRLP